MPPDEKADHCDGDARERDERVAEDALARESRDELALDAHRGQDHDVDRRVRVKPEEMLEEHRIAAARRIEDAEIEDALQADEEQRDRDHRSAENKDDA